MVSTNDILGGVSFMYIIGVFLYTLSVVAYKIFCALLDQNIILCTVIL